MTIQRVRIIPWGSGEKLSSGEQNAIDLNTTYALDKRDGHTDTIASVVQATGAARIIPTMADGLDMAATYGVAAANAVIRLTSVVTANRIYTLSNVDALPGDTIDVYCDTSFVHEVQVNDNGGTALFTVGNLVTSSGPWAQFRFIGGAWTLFKNGSLAAPGLKSQLFDTVGTFAFVVPFTVTTLRVTGMGSGGGGGGGGGTNGGSGCSGGGGGGARVATVVLTGLTPGASITVTIPAGGAGGAAGAASTQGGDGIDGGDTTFGALAIFYGAMGGQRGLNGSESARSVLGGSPGKSKGWKIIPPPNVAARCVPGSGWGGMGTNDVSPLMEIERCGGGTAGGVGGVGGTSVCAGGGGGASEWAGSAGGFGGYDNGLGSVTNGQAGTRGAGGGGGGSYNAFSSGGTAGGAGGGGQLLVEWVA